MNENGSELPGFTPEDEDFLNDIDAVLQNRKKTEDSFWSIWHNMKPMYKEIFIERSREHFEGSPDDDPDANFFRRMIKKWDEGELE